MRCDDGSTGTAPQPDASELLAVNLKLELGGSVCLSFRGRTAGSATVGNGRCCSVKIVSPGSPEGDPTGSYE